MTEAEWLTCHDAVPMITFLTRDGHSPSARKLRMFACACGRRIWHLLNTSFQTAVETGERFADELVTEDEREFASAAAYASFRADLAPQPWSMDALFTATATLDPDALEACGACQFAHGAVTKHDKASVGGKEESQERTEQAKIVRDIFGNPFRPVKLDRAWLTSDVLALARGIYEERAFDRMPILADALQDAGCDNEDVLNHCRDPHALHVRGCWVVDLVLGKG